MHILIADLNEDAAALGEQIPSHSEAVAQIAQVAVNAEFSGIAERLDLLRLTGQVLRLGILDVALAGAHLPVAAELDTVRTDESTAVAVSCHTCYPSGEWSS